jgi:hypothetical protein
MSILYQNAKMELWPQWNSFVYSIRLFTNIRQRHNSVDGRRIKLKDRELGLIQGFLLCLCDSEAVRLQTSRWKRSLLVFSSGVCLEIAALPCLGGLLGYQTAWHLWVLTGLFAPLGLVGLYASKYGHDRLVERLLVIPKLDLRW